MPEYLHEDGRVLMVLTGWHHMGRHRPTQIKLGAVWHPGIGILDAQQDSPTVILEGDRCTIRAERDGMHPAVAFIHRGETLYTWRHMTASISVGQCITVAGTLTGPATAILLAASRGEKSVVSA